MAYILICRLKLRPQQKIVITEYVIIKLLPFKLRDKIIVTTYSQR